MMLTLLKWVDGIKLRYAIALGPVWQEPALQHGNTFAARLDNGEFGTRAAVVYSQAINDDLVGCGDVTACQPEVFKVSWPAWTTHA
jgi:hypothetical protein